MWLGVDLVAVSEVEEALAAFGKSYLDRVFSPTEISDCAGDPRRLAARVAAKEAVIKALRTRDIATPPRDVELVSGVDGPHIRLSGALASVARGLGWGSPTVSISHTDCHAVAVVVALPVPT